MKKPKGYWILKDISGSLSDYCTRVSASVYKNKKSGLEYIKGCRVVNFEDIKVDLIEDNAQEWEFYVKETKGASPELNLLEELLVSQFFKK